ncbi:MAG TPA: hypothetical protein VFO21_03505 [Vicinamibacterales bacterium]|nr:hypothetical protein [Vicinamibacterales bacterium]
MAGVLTRDAGRHLSLKWIDLQIRRVSSYRITDDGAQFLLVHQRLSG